MIDVLADDRGAFFEDAMPDAAVALQRVAVRMLFDPAFVDRVYADPLAATRGLGIPEVRARQLVENDRRLWGADPLRRNRALKALMEEYRVSSTLVLALTGKLASLDGFFGSAPFHDAVQRRGYMAIAFASYLEHVLVDYADSGGHARAVLTLEAGMARARRAAREMRRGRDPDVRGVPSGSAERWVVAGGRRVVAVPEGTVRTVQHVETWLFETSLVPAMALCGDAPRPEPLPTLGASSEYWMLEPGEDASVEIVSLEQPWFALVEACSTPRTSDELASELGAPARGRAEALADAGVLRRIKV